MLLYHHKYNNLSEKHCTELWMFKCVPFSCLLPPSLPRPRKDSLFAAVRSTSFGAHWHTHTMGWFIAKDCWRTWILVIQREPKGRKKNKQTNKEIDRENIAVNVSTSEVSDKLALDVQCSKRRKIVAGIRMVFAWICATNDIIDNEYTVRHMKDKARTKCLFYVCICAFTHSLLLSSLSRLHALVRLNFYVGFRFGLCCGGSFEWCWLLTANCRNPVAKRR